MTTTVLGTSRVVNCTVSEVSVGAVAYLAARFDVDVITVGRVRLAECMDALAELVPAGSTKRVYAWPVETVSVPCAVVGYPSDEIEFDTTFGRGSDRVRIPVYFMVGKVSDRTARDNLSAILTGAVGIKEALDATLTIEEH